MLLIRLNRDIDYCIYNLKIQTSFLIKQQIMKKIFYTLFLTIISLTSYAQSSKGENYYKGIESYRDLQLTSEQIAKIKGIKKEAELKFQSISNDRSLSGSEKGQKKKESALKLKQDIENVLTKEQKSNWESKYGKYTSLDDIKNKISATYESKKDALNDKFEKEKALIDNNNYLSKDEKNSQKDILKQKYKEEKAKLKDGKEKAKKIID